MNDDNRTLWIVLGILAIFVVCLIIALLVVLWYYNPATSDTADDIDTIVALTMAAITSQEPPSELPPTEAFEPTATVTMIAITKVPVASPTPTNTISPIPTQTPTISLEDPRATLGPPTWQDTFDNENNWTLFDDECFKSEIENGKYIMTNKTAPSATCWEVTWPRIQNFYLETTSNTTESCEGTDRYGMIFRAPDPSQGYLFGLTCDGNYGMARWDPDEKQWDYFVEFTPSEVINAGPDQTNRIGVMADGDHFGLYINGFLVTEVDDDTYLEEGLIGYFIGPTVTEDFQVNYDELAYWEKP